MLRRWEDAAHCEIGKAHPEAYVTALRDFLRPDAEASSTRAETFGEKNNAANNIKPFVRPSPFVAETEKRPGTTTKATRGD